MAFNGNDQLLVKIAVFGFAATLVSTAMISILLVGNNGDYNFDEISDYRNDLVSFSGESMINENPWILTHVYTPWNDTLEASTHIDQDGWLYGDEILDYPYLNKSAAIKLETNQKSTVPITYTEDVTSFEAADGVKWWGKFFVTEWIGSKLGFDPNKYSTVTADNWNFSGYRYVFDPTLPFKVDDQGNKVVSSADGSLSLVWYSYNGQEGLSGGLDVYGGRVLLASYSATDIIADYNSSSGYATTYDFDFSDVMLTLSIRFDQSAIESGMNLIQAWSQGYWSMAVSSISAGNFFDLENSATFTTSAGSMIKTFTQIFTFSVPSISNPWMDVVLWMLVGLPMTIAMLCVGLRLVEAAKPF